MKRSSALAEARKSVAEPHHRLNILSPYPQYTLPPLVHLLSFPVDAPLPVRRFFFSPAVEHSVLSRCLSLSLFLSIDSLPPFDFFFLFLLLVPLPLPLPFSLLPLLLLFPSNSFPFSPSSLLLIRFFCWRD